MTQFCKVCVISSNRPIASREYSRTPGSEPGRMAFDGEVCGACKVHDAKGTVDWAARDRDLRHLLGRFRRQDGRPDVLVPGSGGKDSVLAAHVLATRYDMHPLTVTWAPHEYTEVGRRNFYRWLHLGFDNLLVTPNPRVHRLLTRLAFENLGHPFQPFVLGQRNLAPIMAQRFGIGLVMFGELDDDYEGAGAGWQDQRETPPEPRISGLTLAELAAHGITRADLHLYVPTETPAVEARALGSFLRWDPEEAYYYAVENAGFEANEERTEGTFTKFSSIDDRLDPLHYATTYWKFGVGRASHDASMEIRHGRMTRAEGVALVQKYDHEIRETTIEWACGYMGITRAEFDEVRTRFTKSYPVVS